MNGRPHLVFVYGTLKRGGSNHGFLRGQDFVGPARLAAGFALYSLGGFPGLVAEPGSTGRVTGELWAVDSAALARLDVLEGLDEGLYTRIPAVLDEWPDSLPAAEAARAELYLYLGDVSGRELIGDTWQD